MKSGFKLFPCSKCICVLLPLSVDPHFPIFLLIRPCAQKPPVVLQSLCPQQPVHTQASGESLSQGFGDLSAALSVAVHLDLLRPPVDTIHITHILVLRTLPQIGILRAIGA